VAPTALSVISGAAVVRCTDALTFSCGRSTPRWRRNNAHQAPAARITAWQEMGPRSVSTCETLPASVSSERAAQPSRIVAPARSAARASAGTARVGSARASLGVNRAPLKRRCVGLGGRQEVRIELVIARVRQPGFEVAELVGSFGEIGDAALVPADVLADLAGNPLPEPQRQNARRQLSRIAPLLADPAPVA
jgi:hypothetical protein